MDCPVRTNDRRKQLIYKSSKNTGGVVKLDGRKRMSFELATKADEGMGGPSGQQGSQGGKRQKEGPANFQGISSDCM